MCFGSHLIFSHVLSNVRLKEVQEYSVAFINCLLLYQFIVFYSDDHVCRK